MTDTVQVSSEWVNCPICGESDMHKTCDADGNSLIHCVNHKCGSNVATTVPKTDLVWYDDKGITLDSLPDLMQVANSPQFGEGKREDLCRFLMCEAFERRFSPDDARAFHLAAMIISRVKP